jgi:hypothetical protein
LSCLIKPFHYLRDEELWQEAWADGRRIAESETGVLNRFPKSCPWSAEQIMNFEFWPE